MDWAIFKMLQMELKPVPFQALREGNQRANRPIYVKQAS